MPENKEGGSQDSGKKGGVLKELRKGNKRSLLGIAIALAGIIVAWFLYQRSQAQQQAAATTYMPYTPNATAGTAGVPLSDDMYNQLFQQQGQFQTSMDLGFSGLSDSIGGLTTKIDALNSSLSSHETPGGNVVPIPGFRRRYVMAKGGHPISYAWLTGAGYTKQFGATYVTTGKGGLPKGVHLKGDAGYRYLQRIHFARPA